MKEKLNNLLSTLKNNKKKVVGITLGVFFAFIFTFATYNINNPTYFNRLFANVLNNGTPANEAFEDNTFYSCIIDEYNNENSASKAYTDSLTDEELASITSLNCDGTSYSDNDKITSAKGIEKLTGLTSLHLPVNKLTSIDLSNNTALTSLNLSDNQLTSIDLSNNTALIELYLSNNQLTSIDLSNNTALTTLYLYGNQLTSIDLSNNTALETLNLNDNQLTSIDLSNNISLTIIELYDNQLTSIDLSNNTALTTLQVDNNPFEDIPIMAIGETYIIKDSIKLPSDKKLTYSMEDTSIAKIENNVITALKSGTTRLIIDTGYIDVNNNDYKIYLNVEVKNITTVFEDSNFNTCVVDTYNSANGTSKSYTEGLTDDELASISNLSCSGKNISDISGIEKMKNLISLDLSYNHSLNSISIESLTNLETLNLYSANLSNINISKNTKLKKVNLAGNLLTSIDVSNNKLLEELNLGYGTFGYANNITNIDLSNNIKLQNLDLSGNGLNNLDLSNNIKLTSLIIKNNDNDRHPNNLILNIKKVMFVGNKSELNTSNINIIPPSGMEFSYQSDNENVFDVKNNIITAKKSGTANLLVKMGDITIDSKNINVSSINVSSNSSSPFYAVDNNAKYINIKGSNDLNNDGSINSDSLLNNINVSSAVQLEKSIEDNKLKLTYDGELVSEYNIIGYKVINNKLRQSDDSSGKYIYVGNNNFNLSSDLVLLDVSAEKENNNLVIKYNNKIIDTIPIISYQLDYDIIEQNGLKYIYLKDKAFDASKITTNNCEYIVDSNILTIYSEATSETIYLANIDLGGAELKGSSVYINADGDLYTNCNNCNVNNLGNYVYQISIDNYVVDTIYGVKIETSDWNIRNHIDNYGNIYLGVKNISEMDDFNIINGYYEEKDNELVIYESENKEYELKRLDILRISSDKYDLKSTYSKENRAYYIYNKNKKIDINSINVSDGLTIEDQEYNIIIRDSATYEELEYIYPISIYTSNYSDYKLIDNCVYLGLVEKNNTPYINVNNGYAQKNGNKFDIYTSAGQKVDSLDIISLEIDDSIYDKMEYEYEFRSSALYFGTNVFNPLYITNKINCTYEYSTETATISVKHNDKLVDEIKIINVYFPESLNVLYGEPNSDDSIILNMKDVNFDKKLIKSITNINEIDKNKINVMNGTMKYLIEEDDGEMLSIYPLLTSDDEPEHIGDIPILSLYSNNYSLSKDYIYLGTKEFENDIHATIWGNDCSIDTPDEDNFLEYTVTDKMVEIWAIGETCDDDHNCKMEKMFKLGSWDLIKASSDKYDLSSDTITLKDDELLDLNSINIQNGIISIDGDTLVIKYNDEVVKKIKVEGGKKENTPNTTLENKTTNNSNVKTTVKATKTTRRKSLFESLFGRKSSNKTTTKTTTTKYNSNTKTKTTTTVIVNKKNISTTKTKSSKTIKLDVKMLVILLVSFNIIFVSILYLLKKDKKENS